MSLLIDIGEDVKESLLESTSETSKVLKNLTNKGRGRLLFCLYFPNLWKSFIEAEMRDVSIFEKYLVVDQGHILSVRS